MDQVPLPQLSLKKFAAQTNTAFRVQLEEADPLSIRLIEAKSVTGPDPDAAASGDAEYEAFSLIFEGPGDFMLPQQIRTIEHDTIGRFEIFLVPIGNERGAYQYEALFNRRID